MNCLFQAADAMTFDLNGFLPLTIVTASNHLFMNLSVSALDLWGKSD